MYAVSYSDFCVLCVAGGMGLLYASKALDVVKEKLENVILDQVQILQSALRVRRFKFIADNAGMPSVITLSRGHCLALLP